MIFGYLCMRMCYLVGAPISGFAISSAWNTNGASLDKVDELNEVANCMDDQTMLNTDQIVA